MTQGIAELAGSPGGAEVGVVDLRDPAQVLRGVSAGKYSQHSTELDRLQRLYVRIACHFNFLGVFSHDVIIYCSHM